MKHDQNLLLTRQAIAVLKQQGVVDVRVLKLERLQNELENLRLQIARGKVGFEVQQRCARCAAELLRLRSSLVDATKATPKSAGDEK